MAQFFLQLHECGKHVPALEPVDVPSVEAAIERASVAARNIMADEVAHGRLCLSCYIVIEDAAHRQIERVLFRELLTITGI